MQTPITALAVLTVSILALSACAGPPRGSEIITIKVNDPEEEIAIRRQLYLVEEAIQLAVIAYELEDLTIDVVIRDLGGLGQTTPDFDPLLEVEGATIILSTTLFTDPEVDLEAVLVGLMAHEVGHALHYRHMNDLELVSLGERYQAFAGNPDGPERDWAMAYEQLTDMTAIAHGFAEPLVAQKIAAQDNITHHHPKHVWNFYLTPEEIRALDADRETLRVRMQESAAIVRLAGLTKLIESIEVQEVQTAQPAGDSPD